MILRIFAIVLAMAAGIAGVMWVVLELAGAVSTTGQNVWYIALGATIAAVALVVIVTARSRSRGMIGLTASMSVLLVAILLTYPSDKAACTSDSGKAAATDPALENAGGIVFEEEDTPKASNCK